MLRQPSYRSYSYHRCDVGREFPHFEPRWQILRPEPPSVPTSGPYQLLLARGQAWPDPGLSILGGFTWIYDECLGFGDETHWRGYLSVFG